MTLWFWVTVMWLEHAIIDELPPAVPVARVQADDALIIAHADDLGPAYPTGISSGALRRGATFGTSATLYAFTTY